MIVNCPRIAFEGEGFVCPLEQGTPQDMWCVTRKSGDMLQLVPVSPTPIDDEKRDGVMLMTRPVITECGKRVYLCTGYPVIRYEQEVIPPDSIFTPSMRVMPSSFDKVLKEILGWRPPSQAEQPTPDVNWWAISFLRGEIWGAITPEKPDGWTTFTVADALKRLEEYDPTVTLGHPQCLARSEEIVRSIRDYLSGRDPDSPAIATIAYAV